MGEHQLLPGAEPFRNGAVSLAALLFLIFLSACQSNAPKPDIDITPGSSQGAWEANALIENKKTGKTNNVVLDFVARRPREMRMEVTTQLGIHLASFVLSGDRVNYALTRQRKYVSAPAVPDAMKDLIAISLDPNAVVDLLFDRAPDASHWNCKFGDNKLPLECKSKEEPITLVWSKREQFKRLLKIEAPAANVTMSLQETQAKVQIDAKVFSLPAPKGYHETRLQ